MIKRWAVAIACWTTKSDDSRIWLCSRACYVESVDKKDAIEKGLVEAYILLKPNEGYSAHTVDVIEIPERFPWQEKLWGVAISYTHWQNRKKRRFTIHCFASIIEEADKEHAIGRGYVRALRAAPPGKNNFIHVVDAIEIPVRWDSGLQELKEEEER